MNPDQKYQLVTRNVAEVVRGDQILAKLKAGKQLKIYWGTAPTGRPHLGYFIPLMKLSDFLEAGCHVTILLADLHAMLDNLKSTSETVQARTEYYQFVLIEMLKLVLGTGKVNEYLQSGQFRIVTGSSYQLEKDYMLDVLKLCTQTHSKEAQKASCEVVKQGKNPLVSNLIYPLMQSLDEQYLDADIQFGGIDQRKIFMFSIDNMDKMNYPKRSYIMNPLVPGLTKSGKMSSSEPNSKIELDDSPETIRQKMGKSFSVDGLVDNGAEASNALLCLLRHLIFPIQGNGKAAEGKGFTVPRDDKWGGDVHYESSDDFLKDFKEKKMASVDLKPAIGEWLVNWLEPLRAKIEEKSELLAKAYGS